MRLWKYGPARFQEQELQAFETQAGDCSADTVWFDVDGVGDVELIARMGERFGIHHLALEDVVHVHQRAKCEIHGDFLFVVVRMISSCDPLETEQLSILLRDNLVLTFQEGLPGDCIEPVRERLRRNVGSMRSNGAGYLVYAIIDAVVDHMFPVLEQYCDRLETIEDDVLAGQRVDEIRRLHGIKRELLSLRRTVWPIRELLVRLRRGDEAAYLSDETKLHVRDVADHMEQILDLIETYRELARNLIDLQLSMASHRMNETMKVLTVLGAVFLPLSFVAGVYGMNFSPDSPWNMPELHWYYGYPFVLGLMVVMATTMLVFFRRRGWLD